METNKESNIYELFENAGRVSSRTYRGKREELKDIKSKNAVRRFKGALLWFCQDEAVKSLDELANALVKVKVAKTMQEGRRLVPQLINSGLCYYNDGYKSSFLSIKPAQNEPGSQKFCVQTCSEYLGP